MHGQPVEPWFEANRAWWDERVPIHLASDFYGVDQFRAGRSTLEPFEVAELGDMSERSLVHLQCHFGLDTLSCARLGARVTGLDFSAPAIEAARQLAVATGLEARFEVGNVYDAPDVLRERYDIVYTGKGALAWLPDLAAWADVVVGLLRPRGTVYLAEFHPFTDVFADQDLTVRYGYFGQPEPMVDETPGTYADPSAATTHNRTGEWAHPIGEVLTELAVRGLRVRFVHEVPFTLFPRWPFLERGPDGVYRLPPGMPDLPLLYSVRATLDAADEEDGPTRADPPR